MLHDGQCTTLAPPLASTSNSSGSGQTQCAKQALVSASPRLASRLDVRRRRSAARTSVGLLALLAGVGMHQHVVGARARADAAQQVVRRGEHEARRVGVAQPSAARLVPGVGQSIAVAQRDGGRLEQAGGTPSPVSISALPPV